MFLYEFLLVDLSPTQLRVVDLRVGLFKSPVGKVTLEELR